MNDREVSRAALLADLIDALRADLDFLEDLIEANSLERAVAVAERNVTDGAARIRIETITLLEERSPKVVSLTDRVGTHPKYSPPGPAAS